MVSALSGEFGKVRSVSTSSPGTISNTDLSEVVASRQLLLRTSNELDNLPNNNIVPYFSSKID
eukprot:8413333-Pyramimonas_sp.AAC.1